MTYANHLPRSKFLKHTFMENNVIVQFKDIAILLIDNKLKRKLRTLSTNDNENIALISHIPYTKDIELFGSVTN